MSRIFNFPIIPLNSSQPISPDRPATLPLQNNFFSAATTSTTTSALANALTATSPKVVMFSSNAQIIAVASSSADQTDSQDENIDKMMSDNIKLQQAAEITAFTKIYSENPEFKKQLDSLKSLHESELVFRYDLKDPIFQYPANTILFENLKQYFYFRKKLVEFIYYENELNKMIDDLRRIYKLPAVTPTSKASLASPISEGSPMPQPMPSPFGSPILSPVTNNIKSQMDNMPGIQSMKVIDRSSRFNFVNDIVALKESPEGDKINIELKTRLKTIFGIESNLHITDADIDSLIQGLQTSIPYAEKALMLCSQLYKIHELENLFSGNNIGQPQTDQNQQKGSIVLELSTLYSLESSPMLALTIAIANITTRSTGYSAGPRTLTLDVDTATVSANSMHSCCLIL